MSSFLDLAHVTVIRGEQAVLHDINLHVNQGEQIAILGPNGCGKSTLLKTITCELYPLAHDETHVRILERERWDLTELKKRLGFVQTEIPGKPMLAITGLEAVLTGFFSSSMLWPNLQVTPELQDRAEAMLARVQGGALRRKLFGEMSAGQQKRILIARALVASADSLLLDEPSNALDLLAQRELRDLLTSLAKQGTTILHITHHIADIIPAIGRVLLMRDGRIVGDGNRTDLLTAPRLSELFGVSVQLAEHGGHYHAW